MVATKGDTIVTVPLEEVGCKRRTVPLDHDWIKSARAVGTCLGIEDQTIIVLRQDLYIRYYKGSINCLEMFKQG
jgi:hypothetical protein